MRKNKLLSLLYSIALGLFLSFSLIIYKPNMNLLTSLISVGLLLLVYFVFMGMHVIFHELGHLLFGWLNSYSFSSLTIFFLSIKKVNNRFKFGLSTSPGAGQCLMKPKKPHMTLFETIMYNLGGGLTNVILSTLVLLASFKLSIDSLSIIITRLFYIAGFFTALVNLIPLKMGGSVNDGYNILMLLNDRNSLQAVNDTLRINAQSNNNLLYREMDNNLFYYNPDYDYNNPILTMTLINYIYYLFDIKAFSQAYYFMNILINDFDEIIQYYYDPMEAELIYLDILKDVDYKTLLSRYKNLIKILDLKIDTTVSIRIKTAYNYIILDKDRNIEENLKKHHRYSDKGFTKAQKHVENNLMQLLIDYIEDDYQIE